MAESRESAPAALVITAAAKRDAGTIAQLWASVAQTLTDRHGKGSWSHAPNEAGVRRGIETSRVLVAHSGSGLVGTLRLATKKPWAIDPSYFAVVDRPLYLLDMGVAPEAQGQGVGRALIEAARGVARDHPAGSIRLDAYDAPAGAGGFYLRCGFSEVGRVVYRGTPLIYFEWLCESDPDHAGGP